HGLFAAPTTATTGANRDGSIFDIPTLTVTDSSHSLTETFKLTGDLSGSTWTVSDDWHGGANIVDPPAPTGDALGPVVMQDPGVAPAGDALGPVVMQDPGLTQGPTTGAGVPNQTFNGFGVGDVLGLHGVFA